MSQENVEIVRRVIDAFNRGDSEAAMQHFAPDVNWHDQRELPGAQVHHGHAGVLGHLRSVAEDMADYHVEVKAAREVGDNVMVRALVSARGRTSALAVERETFTVFTLDRGRLRESRSSGAAIKPSKPWASRSRRCRRRTWRSCGASTSLQPPRPRGLREGFDPDDSGACDRTVSVPGRPSTVGGEAIWST